MFLLKLFDREGNELNESDVVKVSDGKCFNFYAEVKYLESEKVIAPFHTFSFHSFVKVDSIPENAVRSTETRYKIWFLQDPSKDEKPEDGERYLIDWRCCEHLLTQRCYRIEPCVKQLKLF